MRRKDKEILDRNHINFILYETEIIRIGFNDKKAPYIVPMSFGFNGKNIYLHSAKKGKKIDLINKNNFICFEAEFKTQLVNAENPCDWGMNFESVIGNGRAFFIKNKDEKNNALNMIMYKYSGKNNFVFNEKAQENVEVIKIIIDEIFGKSSYLKKED